MTNGDLLGGHDARAAVAFFDGETEWSVTRAEFRQRVAEYGARTATLRARALDEGRPIALLAAPRLEAFVAAATLLSTETPMLLLHPADPEVRRHALLERTGAVALIDAEGIVSPRFGAEPPLPTLPPRALVVLATSGSTGPSKLVLHSRESLEASVELHRGNLPWLPAGDRYLLQLPFAHVGGFGILFRGLLDAQTTVVLAHAKPGDPAFAGALAGANVTLLSLVPTQLRRLLETDTRLPSSVRGILVGGAPLPEGDRLRAARLGYPLIATYGLTEFGSQVVTERPASEPGGVGYPLGDNEVRLGPRERIEIRGRSAMIGYWGLPPPWTEDGFFPTSDRGRFDDSGRLHVLGRLDHMILSGGENVSPESVEEEALAFAGVAEARCRGEASAEWGTAVIVELVVLDPRTFDRSAFDAHLRARLPRFAVPKRVELVSALPKLPSGKMQRTPLS